MTSANSTVSINPSYEKLRALLTELFQLDHPDLDFGLYRVMQARNAEVKHFLERELLPQALEAFKQYEPAEKGALAKNLADAIAKAAELGVDPESIPKVQDLREKLAESVDFAALESTVFEHLYSFLRRYYDQGDFISKRVYKNGVYVLPYEGEEVKLYWANSDQYYVKTSEYLRHYSFRLRPDDAREPMRVQFCLIDVAEGQHGNTKEAEEAKRVFVLAADNFIDERDRELVFRFQFRAARVTDWPGIPRDGKIKPPSQKELLEIAEQRILSVTDSRWERWLAELQRATAREDIGGSTISVLRTHLNRYSARNTFDYFIHKDLQTFLERELDFYIKNEVLVLDDVEGEPATRIEQHLSVIRVIRGVAKKIIEFLAQLETFQKSLWLKKKFVVETFWWVTVGTIFQITDEETRNSLIAQVLANEKQQAEWADRIAPATFARSAAKDSSVATEALAGQPTLVVDTRHFEAAFTETLLAACGNLDELTDALLVNSENFHALSLLQRKLRQQVDCFYIDPPYNAKSSEILYKNNYKHSTWLTLIDGGLRLARFLMTSDGVFVSAIDEVEQERLGQLLSLRFSEFTKDCIVVNHNPSGQQGDNFSFTHEYAYFMYPSAGRRIAEQLRDGERDWDQRNFRDVTGDESLRTSAKNCFYPIFVRGDEVVGFGDVSPSDFHPSMNEPVDSDTIAVYPIDPNGIERKWRFARQTVEEIKDELKPHTLDRRGVIDIKRLKKTFNYKSNWTGPRYFANNYGSQLLNHFVPNAPALYPKSLHTVRDCLHAALNGKTKALVMDYFAGSGTTGHAVINLNREDAGKRKFVLVEMGDHFDTVALLRLKRVIYSPEWHRGKPTRPATAQEAARSPRLIKLIRLESYEDTLNNLVLRRSGSQEELLLSAEAQGADGFRSQYLMHSMLETETRGSQSLVNAAAFADPDSYKLVIKAPGSDASRVVHVDLIETFNYLIGLTVTKMEGREKFSASFDRDDENRLRVSEMMPRADGPWWFRAVSGITPNGRNILVIWRNCTGKTSDDVEKQNLLLESWFQRTRSAEEQRRLDTVYVNGGNNLEGRRLLGDRWNVRLIDDEFRRAMFELENA